MGIGIYAIQQDAVCVLPLQIVSISLRVEPACTMHPRRVRSVAVKQKNWHGLLNAVKAFCVDF